jgi:UDP-N-acetylglucosamine 2-epimerase (non-hydrolysing)
VARVKPDRVMVQGDTATAMCGALAAYYRKIPVDHVEAGLRSGNIHHPWPEEVNRKIIGTIADLHFAPTEGAASNLRGEGVGDARIFVTGNTGIDAVLYVRDALEAGRLCAPPLPGLDPSRRLILVTAHRRESFGDGFVRICRALARVAERPGVQLVYPVHRNPNVVDPVTSLLGGLENVLLTDPLDYVPFIDLMRRAWMVITDSGGVQEEGPSLGKPILVLREKTERPEAVAAGTVVLVGTDEDRIVSEAAALLDDPARYRNMCRAHNPYGNGRACSRIAEAILKFRPETHVTARMCT